MKLSMMFSGIALVALDAACQAAIPPTSAAPSNLSAETVAVDKPPTPAPSVDVGSRAADFSATAHDGTTIRMSALRGKEVVLFFYSADEAPGSTREVLAFRDTWSELERRGVVVIGISTDTPDAHRRFAAHLRLPFPLVSDREGALAQAYGVPNRYGFLDYNTVLIGSDGAVKRVYRRVDPTTHVSEVLADLRS